MTVKLKNGNYYVSGAKYLFIETRWDYNITGEISDKYRRYRLMTIEQGLYDPYEGYVAPETIIFQCFRLEELKDFLKNYKNEDDLLMDFYKKRLKENIPK